MIPLFRGRSVRGPIQIDFRLSMCDSDFELTLAGLLPTGFSVGLRLNTFSKDNSAKKVRDEGKTSIQTLSDTGCHRLSSMMMGPRTT